MKKKILAALAAVSVVTALVPVTSAFAAEEEYTIKVHYERDDIAEWNVWKWDAADKGSSVLFENGVATWTTSDTDATFIVARIDWTDREDGDKEPYDPAINMGGGRSIDFTKAVDGVIDIYVAQGSTDNSYEAPNTPAESTPAESTPAESTPAESTPAESTPAESTPAESTPASSAPATSTPANSTANSTATSNAGTNNGNANTGVEGIAIGVVAVAAAGAVVLAKKSKK